MMKVAFSSSSTSFQFVCRMLNSFSFRRNKNHLINGIQDKSKIVNGVSDEAKQNNKFSIEMERKSEKMCNKNGQNKML